MSDQLVPFDEQAAQLDATLADLKVRISDMLDLDVLRDVRARVEAARAWAKVHNKLQQVRKELLRVEVDALVRIVELGGLKSLKATEQAAAKWLAAMTKTDRDDLLNTRDNATTAIGMCRSVWREEEIVREQDRLHQAGIQIATSPEPPPNVFDGEAIKAARRRIVGVGAALNDLIESYTSAGAPFSVQEVADELIDNTANGYTIKDDGALIQGIQHVVRQAIRTAPSLAFEGTLIPRTITVRIDPDEGSYVRIPTENATIAHLDDMIIMREEQLAADTQAVNKLKKFATRLREIDDSPTARIGDLISSSIQDGG